MRKLSILLFVSLISLVSSKAVAQKSRPDQVFGLSFSTSNVSRTGAWVTDTSAIHSDYTATIRQFGIVYGFRYDLLSWKQGSISLGSPLMLGFSTTNKYRSVDVNGTKKDTITGLMGTNVAFEIPVFADLNIGLHSAEDDSRDHSFGVYVGVGYLYSYTRIRTSLGRVNYDGFEPAVRAGIRLGKSWENRFSIAFTMRGGYKDNGMRTYGLQLLKEL